MTIEKLQTIITELNSTMASLLEASKSKQHVLINRDHENLNSMINHEQRLISEMNALSQQQKSITAKFKEEYGVPEQLTSLTDILQLIGKKIDVETRNKMMQILNEIKNNAEELGNINTQNKILIETSREFIRGIIHAVRGNDNKSLINRKI